MMNRVPFPITGQRYCPCTIRRFSVKVSIFVLVFLMGCSSAPRPSPLEIGTERLALLSTQYGEIRNQGVRDYLNSVALRLSSASDRFRRNSLETRFSIVVLTSNHPLAFSVGGGLIALSRGLLQSLATEGELAFVLAHEIAHEYLGHCEDNSDLSADDIFERESAADKMGLGIMAIAGYDPRSAIPGLIHSYKALQFSIHPQEVIESPYPALTNRVQVLEHEISESHWQPPGTIDKREFQKLKLYLRTIM